MKKFVRGPRVTAQFGQQSFDEWASTAGRVLGLDEAGRGSLIGPLVVGGFLTRSDQVARLSELGIRDSKLLSRPQREAFYRDLARYGRRSHLMIPPQEIDRFVRRGRLNHLEAEGFATLVRRTCPDRVVVDACDVNARRFGAQVARLSRTRATIRSEHKADRNDVVVAAASIVAKVWRDRAIDRLAEEVGEPVGSGYPSDPRTVRFVSDRLSLGPAPPYVRASWSTLVRIKLGPSAHRLEKFGK